MKKLLLLTLALAAISAQALTFTSGKYSYSTDNMPSGTVACMGVASGQTTSASILIPGTVQYNGVGYRVKTIANGAFTNNATATILKVAWGVETIGQNAFYGSKLKYVYLPSSISSIGDKSFYCSDLVRFCIATNKKMPTVTGAPFMTSHLPEIVRNPVLHSSYESSYEDTWKAFSSNGSITENGRYAFDFENDSQYYVITSSVEDTGTKFAMLVGAHNQKTSIDLKNSMANSTNSEYGGNSNFSCYLKGIADYAFKDNSTITSVGSMNDQTPYLEIIGSYSFHNCTSLKTLWTCAKWIFSGAFKDCSALDEVHLVNHSGADYTVSEISTRAFWGCAITELYIPTNLTYLGNGAFGNCKNLTTITKSPLNTNYDIYNDCLYDTRNGYLMIAPAASSHASMTWRSYTKGIADYAFSYNANITTLEIPHGITYIGAYAFADMEKCNKIKIPSSVTDFSQSAFRNMRNLKYLYFNIDTIPEILNGTTTAGGLDLPYPTFEYINSDAKLYVPRGCRNNFVANDTWNSSFASIVDGGPYDLYLNGLYYTVTSTELYTDTNVQSEPAKGQAKLVYPLTSSYDQTEMVVANTAYSYNGDTYIITSIDRHAFDGNVTLQKIRGGNGVKTIPIQAFKDCSNLTTCELPHVETIGEQAFYNLSNLKSFTWGDCLKTIGDNAFSGTGLNTEVVLPATVQSIGYRSFYNCASLPGLFISNPTGGSVAWQFYGNNASGFKCYVPLTAFYRQSNFATWTSNGVTADTQMHPYIKPVTEWSLISCHKPLTLPGSAEFYIADGYNTSKQMITTVRVTGKIAALNGLLVKAQSGTVYRFTTATNGSNPSINLLKGADQQNVRVETTTGDASNYNFNTTTNVFDLIASYKYYQPGQAWLEVPEANNASTIQIDQLYQGEELKHGDVNRDGDVNVSDVTALINMILGNIPKDEEVADVNEDTQINVSDVTALINIILGNI